MIKLKTNKALSKRIKVTGSGKILKRALHQSHFNAKESGNKTRRKRKTSEMSSVDIKKIKQILPNI
ncbi:MAG: 50S ribosomal protein L35 [Patescibacteria group bacterium]|nr:50S ribosomal protein L35 [Patescibacteria group bacterium]